MVAYFLFDKQKKKHLTPLHENEPKGKRVDDDVKQQQQQ